MFNSCVKSTPESIDINTGGSTASVHTRSVHSIYIHNAAMMAPDQDTDLIFWVTIRPDISTQKKAIKDIVLNYQTFDDTAIAGEDYMQTSGTVTIPKGQDIYTFRVPIIPNEGANDSEKRFMVRIEESTNNTLPEGSIVVRGEAEGIIGGRKESGIYFYPNYPFHLWDDSNHLVYFDCFIAPSGSDYKLSFTSQHFSVTGPDGFTTQAVWNLVLIKSFLAANPHLLGAEVISEYESVGFDYLKYSTDAAPYFVPYLKNLNNYKDSSNNIALSVARISLDSMVGTFNKDTDGRLKFSCQNAEAVIGSSAFTSMTTEKMGFGEFKYGQSYEE